MTNHPWSFVRILAILLGMLFVSLPVIAQDTCPTAETLAALTEACQASATDSACTVTGDSFPLDQLPDDGQPQVIRLSGGLTLTLVGSQISAYEQGELAGAGQLEISNSAGYNLNLRSAPDANAEVVGTFKFDARLPVDGQSADGNWLRVRLEDGSTAWVSKKLVSGDPALADLPVVDPNSSVNVGHSLTIERIASACAESPAGVFITAAGETTQRLTINELPLAMTNGKIVLTIDKTGLTFYGLAGNSSLGTGANQQNLTAGEVLNWSDKPVAANPLPAFPALDVLEALALTPEGCLVAALEAPLDASAAPDDNTVVMTLAAGSYPIVAQTSVNNASWLQLTEAFGGGWVSSDLVETLGACDTLPDAAEPGATNATPEPKLTPDQVMYSYLAARLQGDTPKMQTLSCASWDAQALLQSQSFRAMRTELVNVTCATVSQTKTDAIVHCGGYIQTEYNGDFRQWPLGSYTITQENGSWRMCGEAD